MYVIFMTSVPLSRRGYVAGSLRNRATRRATSNCNQSLHAFQRYFYTPSISTSAKLSRGILQILFSVGEFTFKPFGE